MIAVADLIRHLDALLESLRFKDSCENGLQVEGRGDIRTLATAATASLASCQAAVAAGADALLVHHGLIWGGTTAIRRPLAQRLATLLAAPCTLIAYHLPLDAHPVIGNNALALALVKAESTGPFAEVNGRAIGLTGRFTAPLPLADLVRRCQDAFHHPVTHCPGGPDAISRIGVVTGAGARCLREAAALGLQVLITGEAPEHAWYDAAELGCHLLACGHHATECLAVHRLGQTLARDFGLQHVALSEHNPL